MKTGLRTLTTQDGVIHESSHESNLGSSQESSLGSRWESSLGSSQESSLGSSPPRKKWLTA